MAVKINLRNIETRIEVLGATQPFLFAGAIKARELILLNWNQTKGADGKTLNRLTREYAKKKKESGRKPIPDMQWTGAMRRGFVAKKRGREAAVVTFEGAVMPRARGNYDARPGLFKVSETIKKAVREFVWDRIMKAVKK